MSKTMIICKSEKRLDAFKFGFDFGINEDAVYTQTVTPAGYHLLIEVEGDGQDNVTYALTKDGLVFQHYGVLLL